jgi:hypothetical protein
LEHQIIRGDFRDEEGQRTVDLLNSAASGAIIALANAWTASLHYQATPARLHTARVRRTQVFMVVPSDAAPLPPRRFRTGFSERQALRALVGLGPFTVAGTHYIGLHEQPTLVTIEHDPTGRFFIPITDAVVRSQYNPKWTFEAPLILINRGAIAFTAPLPPAK